LKQCFSNLALEVIITKETKWHLLCCRCDSSSGPVLIKTTIPSFCINQAPSTPANIMMRVKTMWLPCLLQRGPSVLLLGLKVIFGLFLLWCTLIFWCQVWRALPLHFQIFFILSVFYHLSCKPHDIITFLICIIPGTSISLKQKKIFQKEKNKPFLFFLESLSNKQQLFFIS